MSCERHAGAIVDHACGAEIAGDALAHLGGCSACREMFDEQKRLVTDLDRQLQSALEIEPSARFVPEVMAGVQRAASRGRGRIWWSVPAAAAAAAALILSMLGSLRSSEQQAVTGHDPGVRTSASAPPAERTLPTLVPPAPSVELSRVPHSRRRIDRPRGDVRRPRVSEVEVIVPAEHSLAMTRYLALVRRGVLDTSALAGSDQTGVAPPANLVIVPLSVDALAMPNAESEIGPDVGRRGPGLR
jgi:hypothetical protein